MGGAGDDLVVRGEGLDHRPAVLAAPARPAHHLGQQAEGPLGGPVVVHVEAQVRRQDPHQGHVLEIQPLGHHLGTQENGDLLCLEPMEQDLVVTGDSVRVHAEDLRLREELVELLLHLLGAGPYMLHQPAALIAPLPGPLGVTAVVAHEPAVGAVVGQGNTAPGTLRHRPALPAQQHPAAAPAVEKENALLPPAEVLRQLIPKRGADGAGVAGADLLPQVRDEDPGQGLPVVAAAEDQLLVRPPLGLPGALHRGSGGAQQQHRAVLGAEKLGHVPGVVAGRVLRLVAVLVLLVQNDHT